MSSLTEREKRKIEDGLRRLKEGNLDLVEAEELQSFVENKKHDAFNIGDMALAMGLILLGAALVMYLTERKGR
jgi:hypothetical protein